MATSLTEVAMIVIHAIEIVRSTYTADTMYLKTNLPHSVNSAKDKMANMTLTVGFREGEGYCKKFFPGVPVKVTEV